MSKVNPQLNSMVKRRHSNRLDAELNPRALLVAIRELRKQNAELEVKVRTMDETLDTLHEILEMIVEEQ